MNENISKHIDFDKLDNTRDLGGMVTQDGSVIKPNLLFRSGRLVYASKKDIEKLTSFNIAKIIDFRKPDEASLKPNPQIGNCKEINLSIIDPLIDDVKLSKTRDFSHVVIEASKTDKYHGHKTMLNIYHNIIASEYANKQYIQFVKEIVSLKDGEAILWHCSSGKDRAGFASVIVEAILGVSKEDILKDYLSTNIYTNYGMNHISKKIDFNSLDDKAKECLKDIYLVKEEYFKVWEDYIDKEFNGSIDKYLEESLKVDSSIRKILRDRYLEKF